MLGGEPHQVCFGMVGDIVLGHDRILGLKNNLVVGIYQQRAKGMVAMRPGLRGEGDGCTKMLKIRFVHQMIPNSLALFTACNRPLTLSFLDGIRPIPVDLDDIRPCSFIKKECRSLSLGFLSMPVNVPYPDQLDTSNYHTDLPCKMELPTSDSLIQKRRRSQ
jgi:hypothetical protein